MIQILFPNLKDEITFDIESDIYNDIEHKIVQAEERLDIIIEFSNEEDALAFVSVFLQQYELSRSKISISLTNDLPRTPSK